MRGVNKKLKNKNGKNKLRGQGVPFSLGPPFPSPGAFLGLGFGLLFYNIDIL